MQIVKTSDCNSRDSYSGRITPAMICAGIYPNGGIDTCQVRLMIIFWGKGCVNPRPREARMRESRNPRANLG